MEAYDFQQFFNAWVSAHSISTSNKIPDNKDVSKAFDLLAEYPLHVVIGALNLHSKSSRFAPTVADICAIIDSRSGNNHLGPEEAWGIVVASFDEEVTIVMTQEMFEARGTALPVWLTGDKIGARMVFREKYSRLLEFAGPPKYAVSEGIDKAIKSDALRRAVDAGLLTNDQAARYLPGPMDGGIGGKLLTGKTLDETETQMEYARKLKLCCGDAIKKAEEKERLEQQQKENEKAKKRDEIERKRQELLAQVEMLQEKKLGVI